MEPVYHWYLESVFRENILIAHIHLIFNKWVHLLIFCHFSKADSFETSCLLPWILKPFQEGIYYKRFPGMCTHSPKYTMAFVHLTLT